MTALQMNTRIPSNRVDAHIAWLRTTSPQTVMEETAHHLARGVPEDELWTAGALTACRYLNNQSHDFRGSASSALPNCAEARSLGRGQSDRLRHLLLLLSLHRVTHDLQNPCFSPYELLPAWPLQEDTVAETIAQLRHDVRRGDYMCADHHFIALADRLPRARLFDLLMDMGLEKTGDTEHALTSLLAHWELIEAVGWDRGSDMLRCFVRYCGSFAADTGPYDHAVELLTHNKLGKGAPSSEMQPDLVAPICAALRAVEPSECAEVAAQAMSGDRVSPATVLTAVARIACEYVLAHNWIPLADAEAAGETTIPFYINDALRCMRVALRTMSPRTQALAAIHASHFLLRLSAGRRLTQPGVLPAVTHPILAVHTLAPALQAYSTQEFHGVIREALYAHDNEQAISAIHAYAHAGGAPELLIALLTEAAMTNSDMFTCSIKHLCSMVWEFQRTEAPEGWQFLQLAAKRIAIYAGLNDAAYRQADQALSKTVI